jgi:hypothetical protein
MVIRSVAASNLSGLRVYQATLAISQSTVFGNNKGWSYADTASSVQSYGDNEFNANAGNDGILTPVTKQ